MYGDPAWCPLGPGARGAPSIRGKHNMGSSIIYPRGAYYMSSIILYLYTYHTILIMIVAFILVSNPTKMLKCNNIMLKVLVLCGKQQI